MSAKAIIVETTLDQFWSGELNLNSALSRAERVHFVDGLLFPTELNKVASCLGKAGVKLSMTLQARDKAKPWCRQALKQALQVADYIELNAEEQLSDELLALIPAHQRLIYRSLILKPNEDGVAQINRYYQADIKIEAQQYRYICDDGMVALEFLHQLKQTNVIAYAPGQQEIWSRLCASYKGLSCIYTEFAKDSKLSVEQLQKNYKITALPPQVSCLYGIVGSNIDKSFSPLVHNTGLRALQLPGLYLAFNIDDMQDLDQRIKRLAAIDMPLKGLTVTAPLKATLDQAFKANRQMIEHCQSANVLTQNHGHTVAESTDDSGLLRVLKQHHIKVQGKRVAILGSGCSGRVSAYSLSAMGAQVTMFNRNLARSLLAQKLLKLPCKPLEQFGAGDFDILINAAPFATQDDLVFSLDGLHPDMVYIDFVYNPFPNALLVEARSRGLKVIDGLDMLNSQLLSQFKCLTGQALPVLATKALERILSDKRAQGGSLNNNNPNLDKVS